MATLIGNGSHALDILASDWDVKWRVIPHHLDWDGSAPAVIAINDPRTRASVSEFLGLADLAWVHPRAYLGPDCSYGFGTHINYGVTMTRTRLGNHVTVSPGATICGDVTIGDRVLIGAGATICDRVTIEDDVIVGAGAVVLPCSRLEAGNTYVGVPARC